MRSKITPLLFACALLAVALTTVGTLSACGEQFVRSDPIAVATNPEARADAIYGEFVIAEARAAALIADTRVSDNVKSRIKAADAAAYEIAEQIHDSSANVAALRITKPEDVADALLALDQLLTTATPLIRGLQTEVKQP